MLDDRTQRERREECQSTDDENDANEKSDEQRRSDRERTHGFRHDFALGEKARERERRNDHGETTDYCRDAERGVVEVAATRQAREGASIVGEGRRIGVQNLGESVWAGVVQTFQPRRNDARDRREYEYDQR